MSENNQEKIPSIKEVDKKIESSINNWVRYFSIIVMFYLIFSLISPLLVDEQHLPRKIDFPDILLILLILIFNSGLLNRLENFAISKDGGITAKFKQLKQEVNEQKKQIDVFQEEQLEQLKKHQESLEEMQNFMYSLLLTEKDCEKLQELNNRSKEKINYDFYVSSKVADELRRLRGLNLIRTKCQYISDIEKASKHGEIPIDLTEYIEVSDIGQRFLETRKKLQSKGMITSSKSSCSID